MPVNPNSQNANIFPNEGARTAEAIKPIQKFLDAAETLLRDIQPESITTGHPEATDKKMYTDALVLATRVQAHIDNYSRNNADLRGDMAQVRKRLEEFKRKMTAVAASHGVVIDQAEVYRLAEQSRVS